ncbi:kinesin-like protein [Leishmania major strain Friedlin]|uniref:Kinesin-like protein n=1 Tax=Leishmania major TaxID=5664 RepID=Q4QJ61_LEIMA|nr:kinesin-like protein [Leishmania major strain Friedlin]CAG9568810.1 kinesin-like_protein [Leishmania major strain Friedlin]CAJ02061.1 kinesin-like protein [Leishmania major strain Friedlin]|eukprot:XP_001680787.1 kinesin-like protein [Leishmania major strain Friedlin]
METEMAPAPSASSPTQLQGDGHTRDTGETKLLYSEVIRVVTAAGRLTRPISSPYMLEVLRPPAGGTDHGRSAHRPSMPTRQSLPHRLGNGGSGGGGSSKAARVYAFDYCAGPSTTQEEFFDMLEMPALCEAALTGETVTVLCFGQTGSGKTYSLSGRTLPAPATAGPVSDAPTPLVAEDGLQYQAVHYIARRLKELRRSSRRLKSKRGDSDCAGKGSADCGDDGGVSGASVGASASGATVVTAKCSYVELYQESLYDLLQPDGGDGVRCRWSAAASSFFVEGSLMVECRGREDFLLVLREGQRNRQRGSHALNLDSSRSHVVFTVFFEVRDEAVVATSAEGVDSDGAPSSSPPPGASAPLSSTRYGRLVFVDLAGSERLKKTLSTSNAEAGSINKSLFTLGRVLELLSASPPAPSTQVPTSAAPSDAMPPAKASTQQPPFIPYRSSVLTQLLMHSLDGHGRTVMVACVSPSALHLEESLRTLHYAERARHIRATPVVHVDAATQARMALEEKVQELRQENALLRRALGLPRVGKLQDGQVDARLEELHRAWAAAQLATPPHEASPRSAATSPQLSSTSRKEPPPQQRPATWVSPSRPAVPLVSNGATAASGAVGLRTSSPQTVVMSSTESEADDGSPSATGNADLPSSVPRAAAVSILDLLEALPDTRLMQT